LPASGRRAHEPAELTLQVRRLDDGSLRFATPTCPGWAFVARRPQQIGEAIARAYAEAQVAAYARLRGVLYDLAEHEEEVPPEAHPRGSRHPSEPEPAPPDEVARRRRKRHPRTHEPEEWVELDSGYWRSPTGRRYGPTTAVVASVRANLGR
jgi:hypothetical protein